MLQWKGARVVPLSAHSHRNPAQCTSRGACAGCAGKGVRQRRGHAARSRAPAPAQGLCARLPRAARSHQKGPKSSTCCHRSSSQSPEWGCTRQGQAALDRCTRVRTHTRRRQHSAGAPPLCTQVHLQPVRTGPARCGERRARSEAGGGMAERERDLRCGEGRPAGCGGCGVLRPSQCAVLTRNVAPYHGEWAHDALCYCVPGLGIGLAVRESMCNSVGRLSARW